MPWCVDVIESESGWGSRVDETIIFGKNEEDQEAAQRYSEGYNKKYNSSKDTPGWYMMTGRPYFAEPTPRGKRVTKYVKAAGANV